MAFQDHSGDIHDPPEELSSGSSWENTSVKTDLASHFHGRHETQVSEGGEADLHLHYKKCEKNPAHKEFTPVCLFTIDKLPGGYKDQDILNLIKATAHLTVRIVVELISDERPEFYPNSDADNQEPYPFYDMRGKNTPRFGTGKVGGVIRYTEKDNTTCPCPECKSLKEPSKVWGKIRVHTATHVVFDDKEALQTTCRLFFEHEKTPVINIYGIKAYADTREDTCMLECVSCDTELLDLTEKMIRYWEILRQKVHRKYLKLSGRDKLTAIVSHPHGFSMQVSVGEWLERYVVKDGYTKFSKYTKYTYTTSTCTGSSGASVFVMSSGGGVVYDQHLHRGVNALGVNYSGTGEDFVAHLENI